MGAVEAGQPFKEHAARAASWSRVIDTLRRRRRCEPSARVAPWTGYGGDQRGRPSRLAMAFRAGPGVRRPFQRMNRHESTIGGDLADGRPDGRLAASVHQPIGGGRLERVAGVVPERSASGERSISRRKVTGTTAHRQTQLSRSAARSSTTPEALADFCLPCEPLVLRHGLQGALEKTTQVVGNRDVRIGRCRRDIGSTGLKRRNEPLKLDCEKLLVQPGNQFGHRDTGRIGATAEIQAPQMAVMLK